MFINDMVIFKSFLVIFLYFYRAAAETGTGERPVSQTREVDALEQIQTETGTTNGDVSTEFFCNHSNVNT